MDTGVDLAIAISGYFLGEQLYCGSKTTVYRGVRVVDQQSVVVKLLNREYPTFHELLQFRNQYAIAKNLDIPGIIRCYSLESYRNSYALVMEDFGGISLWQYSQSQSLSLIEIFTICLQLTDILHELHQNRVIHKDIKPANILINPVTKQVKLIDFSIASLLPKESQEIKNPNVLEGTLAYISPEQTGRMNRGIDYRSDFYSLGITLYELITGELPFIADDPMELLHCHIAKMPNEVKGEEIPQVVSDIVMKLMAKNAEDRYQSALGLKYDLANCLTQLQETGQIKHFEIAQRDVCDRFIIPEKLYGREHEVKTLLAAFDRVADGGTEIMLVAGFSGIGKSAIINEVHKPIVQQRGYFIKGKFDQFNRNIPFSAFVQAFRNLMEQLLSESDTQLANWQEAILQAVGENGQVIIDVIPELERIIGMQPPAPELSGVAAQNRFNLLFQKFIQVFTQPGHPLVMFLDDLQWVDSASLHLIQLLMAESHTGYLLMIGAYRDNEVFAAHPLMLTLEAVNQTGTMVNTITLKPLSQTSLNQLIADTLQCAIALAEPLTKLVYQKTQGNPFFATQFLKALYQDQLITFDSQARHWQCDIVQVQKAALTDDVVEFMAAQLQKLPETTQNILKLAACIGNSFELQTLAIVGEQSTIEIATGLWAALQDGLVLAQSQIYKFYVGEALENIETNDQIVNYRFLHDRVQQAAYSLIPEAQKPAKHLKIGQLLQQKLSAIEQEEKLFDIVGHLNLGKDLITSVSERQTLAQLNLAAGQKARNSTAYAAARSFVQTGRELLTADCWQTQYKLTLNLYVAAAETAYLNADFEGMEVMATQVLQSAQTTLDKVKVYEIQILALTTQSQMLAAIAVGRNALAQLGVEFPSEPDEALTGIALQSLAAQLQGKQIEELVNLPVMSDTQTNAAMQLLAMLFSPIFLGSPALLPLLCARMVSLSIQFGNAPASTMGYAGYGMVLAGFLGEVEKGYSFGRVALNVLNQLNVREFKPQTLILFGNCIQHRREALRVTLPRIKDGYLAGMDNGDFLYVGLNIVVYFAHTFLAGVHLDDWEAEIENYYGVLGTAKQDSAVAYLNLIKQMVHHLRENVNQPDLFIGTAYDETVMFPKYHQANEYTAIAFAYVCKLMFAYVFGNYTSALDYIAQANLYLMAIAGLIYTPIFHFYAGLTYLAQYSNQSEIEQVNTLALVEIHQTTLAQWAHYAPMNHQHKVDLVAAEKCRVLGKKYEAGDLYDRAILGAKENDYIQEQALANELAAKFYLDWGKHQVATGYMQEAYYCYAKWGAKAKITHLEQNYPRLLAAILQPPNFQITHQETITPTLMRSLANTSSSQTSWLDLPTVMKAAQAISQEIELEKLLATLMQMAIANAGAEKGYLLFYQEGQWLIVAQADSQRTHRLDISLEQYQEIPQSVIFSVARSQEMAVFENLSDAVQFAGDRYITTHQPKSVLCTPIHQQGQLIGILYLENNLTLGAFTSDRLQLVQLLTAQAAISLKNAQLYFQLEEYSHTLEAKVSQRTQELTEKATQLESTLQELQLTQTQLVQSEKMSSLGQLVAGIAHEINNPVNFIYGNITYVKQYTRDLCKIVQLYQQPNINPVSLKKTLAELDVDFIQEDLPKTLNSMEVGTERIREIVLSLRTFSRMDEAEFKRVDIHTGIDSTLMILQHRLKETAERPAIEIIKDYGELPLIECYAGQLNQVFMNILSNGVDAIEEKNIHLEFSQIAAHTQQIKIRTLVIDTNWIEIAIADNGIGMTPEVQQKMLNPFFTTKPVGKGTGMGMSITYQIITEKHRGHLKCVSIPKQGTEFIIQIPICQ